MNQALLTTKPATGPDSTLLDLSGLEFVSLLDARITAKMSRITTSGLWGTLRSMDTPIGLLSHFLRALSLETSKYQPRFAESAITAIGRMPRSLNERAVRVMLRHQAEVFTHGEMALRDYHSLGGDVEWARSQAPSPATYAAASVWSAIAHERDSFAYLGAIYASERIVQQIASRAMAALAGRGFYGGPLEFFRFHAGLDAGHTGPVRSLIEKVIERNTGSRESILRGTDNLLNVFPLPVWQTAFEYALECFEREAAA